MSESCVESLVWEQTPSNAPLAVGRNGPFKQCGIEVQSLPQANIAYNGDEDHIQRGVVLRAINSRGRVSLGIAELSVPVDQIDNLIDLLQRAKRNLV